MLYRKAPNADKPGSYQIATRAGKTTINAGDTLQFEQYITGYGNIRTAKIQAYISTAAFDLETSHILNSLVKTDTETGFTLNWGNQKDKLTETGFTCLMAGVSAPGDDESTMIFDASPTSNEAILMSERKIEHAPFEYSLQTKKTVGPGDHYIDFYLTYFNGEKWTTSKERVSFRIRNIFERYAKTISVLALITSISGIVRFALFPLYEFVKAAL